MHTWLVVGSFGGLAANPASPSLALDVEKLIRSWGLAAGEDAVAPATETRQENIKFCGREFTLMHWIKPSDAASSSGGPPVPVHCF